MPEQAADLGYQELLFIGQIAVHIVPNRMEPKEILYAIDTGKYLCTLNNLHLSEPIAVTLDGRRAVTICTEEIFVAHPRP